jgi:hypothetical protein
VRVRSFCIAALFLSIGVLAPLGAVGRPQKPDASSGPLVSAGVRHDTSPPLRDAVPKPVKPGNDREVPIRVPSRLAGKPKPGLAREDPLRQRELGTAAPAPTSLIFEGQSDDDNARVLREHRQLRLQDSSGVVQAAGLLAPALDAPTPGEGQGSPSPGDEVGPSVRLRFS